MKVELDISEQQLNFLKELSGRFSRNDNRCTADPYYYCIRHIEERAVPDGCGSDGVKYFSDEQCESYTLDEVKEQFDEYLYENEYKGEDTSKEAFLIWKKDYLKDEFYEGSFLEAYIERHYRRYDFSYSEIFDNVFLTYEGYKDHMKVNRHNYRYYPKKSVSYVKYATRNAELEGVLDVLKSIGKQVESVELNNEDKVK